MLSFYGPAGGIEYLQIVLLAHDLRRPTIPDPTIYGDSDDKAGFHQSPRFLHFKDSWAENLAYHPSRVKDRQVKPALADQTVWDRIFRRTTWVRGVGSQDTTTKIAKVYPSLAQETNDGGFRPAVSSPYFLLAARPPDDRYPAAYDGGKEWYGPVRDHRERLYAAPQIARLREDVGKAIQYCVGKPLDAYPFWDGLVLANSTAEPFTLSGLDNTVLLTLRETQAAQQADLLKLHTYLVQQCKVNVGDPKAGAVTTSEIDLAISHLLSVSVSLTHSVPFY